MDRKRPFHAPWPVPIPKGTRAIIELSAYRKSKNLLLDCTQLNRRPSEQRRIVDEWCEFFRQPSPVRQLVLVSRVPIPLFEAICHQRELTGLFIKWGPIKDLSPISKLKMLQRLRLGSCSIEDLGPLSALTNLEHLSLGNLDRLSDYSPLAKLQKLEYLEIEGAPFMPKKVWISDLKFLRSLKKLRGLSICAARFKHPDYYTSLFGMPDLEFVDLPRIDDDVREQLVSRIPKLRYGNVVNTSR